MDNAELIAPVTEFWSKTCAELTKLISPDAFKRWFSSIRPLEYDNGTLSLSVENTIYQYWIEENYLPQLNEAAALVAGKEVQVRFECQASADSEPVELEDVVKPTKTQSIRHPATDLITRYTFDTFVVGTNNEFAHAAAKAVAENPGRSHNPLFIHGPVGLGKTHLMHAIGWHIANKKKNPKIVYVTSEQFTNEFITAIQLGQLIQFRKRFRQADVLLIDDIQFFGGKDRSQEEFFHTFNAIVDSSKQIVMTSDCSPSEVTNLEQRLVSRFEWGLTAELQPPDIETRLAILRQKSAKMQVRLGDTVLQFIAERVKANIRRLEGALNRVAAWAALNDKKISQPQVEELLKDFIQQEAKQVVTVESIQRKVAETFDIRMTDMTSKRRPANIALPRMVAMYLTRKMTSKSLQEIGDAFGGRDHGTVLHACKTVEEKIETNEAFRQQIVLVTNRLENPAG